MKVSYQGKRWKLRRYGWCSRRELRRMEEARIAELSPLERVRRGYEYERMLKQRFGIHLTSKDNWEVFDENKLGDIAEPLLNDTGKLTIHSE